MVDIYMQRQRGSNSSDRRLFERHGRVIFQLMINSFGLFSWSTMQ